MSEYPGGQCFCLLGTGVAGGAEMVCSMQQMSSRTFPPGLDGEMVLSIQARWEIFNDRPPDPKLEAVCYQACVAPAGSPVGNVQVEE